MSKDSKYLAYGGFEGLLKIYDVKLDKIINEINLNNAITAC